MGAHLDTGREGGGIFLRTHRRPAFVADIARFLVEVAFACGERGRECQISIVFTPRARGASATCLSALRSERQLPACRNYWSRNPSTCSEALQPLRANYDDGSRRAVF